MRGFDSDTAWPRILPRGWRRGLTYKSGDKEFTLRYSLRGDNTCVVTANDFQEAVFCIKKYFPSIQSAVRGDLDECLQSLSIASGEALADEVNDRVLSLLMFPDRAGQSSSLPKSSSDPEKTKAEPKAEPKCTSKAKLKKPKIGMSIPYPNPSRVPPQPFPQSIGGIGGFADDLLPGWPRHGRKPPWTRHPAFGPGRPGPRRPAGVPPGARFDPYGPSVPFRGPPMPKPGGPPNAQGSSSTFGGPNPDHLPPPGYNDMFL